MADVIGEAFVAIRPDTSGFQREAETGLKSGIGKLAAGLGGLFIADKIGEGLKSVIGAGSDMNETLSKTQAVFDDMTPQLIKWGDTAATSFGLSKQGALESAATIGNLLQSMGVFQGPATQMSKDIVGLAADLGSFNNVPTDEALEAIRSGLVGESEPLRRFGVNLNEAAIKAKAMEMGLYHGEAQISNTAKAQAVYKLILEQTTTAQGDFQRTSGGAANQQKILAARMDDIKAKIGGALLPLYTKLLGIIQKVVIWLSEHQTVAKALAVVIGGALVAAFAAWAIAAASAAVATLAAAAPVIAIIAAIAAVVAAIYFLWTNWDTVWNWIKGHPAIAAIIAFFFPFIAAIVAIVGAVKWLWENWSTIWPQIQRVLQVAYDEIIAPIFGLIKDGISGILFLAGILKGVWDTVFTGLKTAWDTVGAPALEVIKTALGPVIGLFTTLLNLIHDIAGSERGAYSGGKIPHPGNYATAPEGATGGIVTRPTLALIGEAGPEAVVPLSRTPGSSPLGSGWGGDAIHLHYERLPRNGVQIAVEAFHGLRAARQAAAL